MQCKQSQQPSTQQWPRVIIVRTLTFAAGPGICAVTHPVPRRRERHRGCACGLSAGKHARHAAARNRSTPPAEAHGRLPLIPLSGLCGSPSRHCAGLPAHAVRGMPSAHHEATLGAHARRPLPSPPLPSPAPSLCSPVPAKPRQAKAKWSLCRTPHHRELRRREEHCASMHAHMARCWSAAKGGGRDCRGRKASRHGTAAAAAAAVAPQTATWRTGTEADVSRMPLATLSAYRRPGCPKSVGNVRQWRRPQPTKRESRKHMEPEPASASPCSPASQLEQPAACTGQGQGRGRGLPFAGHRVGLCFDEIDVRGAGERRSRAPNNRAARASQGGRARILGKGEFLDRNSRRLCSRPLHGRRAQRLRASSAATAAAASDRHCRQSLPRRLRAPLPPPSARLCRVLAARWPLALVSAPAGVVLCLLACFCSLTGFCLPASVVSSPYPIDAATPQDPERRPVSCLLALSLTHSLHRTTVNDNHNSHNSRSHHNYDHN